MKSSILTLLLSAFSGIIFAQTLYQGLPIAVADGSMYGSFRPRIALDRAGEPVVLWGSNIGGYKGFTSNWNGTGFTTPFRIHPTAIIANNVESPQVASFGDTIYIVYSLSPSSSQKVRIRTSTDGGNTWEEPVAVDSLNSQSELATFPSVTTDSSGNPIVVFMRQNVDYSNPRYVIRRSNDLGATFSPIVDATGQAPGGEACDCCFSSIYAPSANEIIVPFRRNDNNTRDMWASRSIDGGLSFSQSIDLDSTDWYIPACPSSGPVAVFPGDSILAAFMSEGGDGYARIYLSLAHRDSSASFWNDTLNIPGGNGISQNHPALAGNGDTLGIAFEYNSGSDNDIYFAWSTTGVNGLLSCVPVPAGFGSFNQRTPDLKFRDGIFHLVYADNATGDVVYKQLAFFPLVGNDPAEDRQIEVYPNPTLHGSLVRWEGNMPHGSSLLVHNSLGQTLLKADISGLSSFPLARGSWPAGIYFLQVNPKDQPSRTFRISFQ